MSTLANTRRAIGLMMCLLMVLAMATACSTGAPTAAPTSAPAATAAAGAATASAAATEPSAPSWAKDTTPISLDWYDNTASISHTYDAVNCLVDKIITQKTGVTINFISPPEESYEKLNAMTASNSLPDIVMMSYDPTVPSWTQIEQSGQVYPLLDLMDQYAPDFKAAVPQSMIDWYKYPGDGKWYGFTSFYYAAEKMPANFPLYSGAGMVARKDIMDKLGIKPEDFSTQDGFIAALKKVNDAGLTASNGKKMVAFQLGQTVVDDIGWVLGGMFGAYEEDKDGNLVDKFHSPKMLEAAKFANRLYREGYIDISNFTSSMDLVKETAFAGGLFSYMGHMGDFKSVAQKVFSADNTMEYVPVECVRSADGAMPQFSSSNTNGWTMTSISKNCKSPARAINLMWYLYSQEGQMLTLFGQEGVTYTMVDGKAQFTKEYTDAKIADAAKATKDYAVGLYFMMKDPILERVTTAPPTSKYDLIYYNTRNFFSKYVYPDRAFDGTWPDPGSDEDASLTQIADYQTKFMPKVIMAGSPEEVESLYNEMLKHEDELGFQAAFKIEQDKFQANKKRLGLKFGLPIYGK